MIEQLPAPGELRRAAQALAALDAIVCPSAEYRCYTFDAAWAEGESMASMRNGSGDHWFALFTEHGVVMHGLAHEAPTFEPGTPAAWVFAGLPEVFRDCFLDEPAFDTANSTWCVWRQNGDARWRRGPRPDDADDGQDEQLAVLLGGEPAFIAWARDIYGARLDRDAVAAVFRHEAITPELARRLRPAVDYAQLERELRTIGYRAPN